MASKVSDGRVPPLLAPRKPNSDHTGTSSTNLTYIHIKDAIIYAVSGKGVLLSSPKDDEDEDNEEPERHAIEKGDFAFIPAWTEHQVVNESDEEDLHWVITRSGPQPVEVNLKGWYVGLRILLLLSAAAFSFCFTSWKVYLRG